jgi:hypothetical protein
MAGNGAALALASLPICYRYTLVLCCKIFRLYKYAIISAN